VKPLKMMKRKRGWKRKWKMIRKRHNIKSNLRKSLAKKNQAKILTLMSLFLRNLIMRMILSLKTRCLKLRD
jgi:membrane-anchored glycerophosphoryl diester phosphodiesterase (GDPDase)